jgi:hypothetical protein
MNKSSRSKVTFAVKRMTPEEERQLHVAIDLFLAELVRQQLRREKEASERTETNGKTVHRSGPMQH